MYEQTFQIEHRLSDLLRLIGEGRFSTPRLAELLQVSIPTVSRGIKALRTRGHAILSKRSDDGSWCYFLQSNDSSMRGRGRVQMQSQTLPLRKVGT